MPLLSATHTAIKGARLKGNRDTWYSFAGHRGLWLRVRVSGSRVWIFRTKTDGKVFKLVLGKFPDMDFAAAISAMKELRTSAGEENPIEAKRLRESAADSSKKAAEREAKLKPTVASIADKYIGAFVSERRRTAGVKRSAKEDRRLFTKHIDPLLGQVRLEDLRSRDIAAVRDHISAPSEKRKALAVLRALLSHAKSDGLIESNPALGIKTPQSGARDRVLTDAELKMLWNGTSEPVPGVRPTMLAAIRVQLLTAQRAGEVLQMRWSELDRKAHTWLIPSAVAKNGRDNLVPLSPATAVIVFGLPTENAYVFPGHRKSPVSSSAFAQLVDRVRVALGLEHFTSHDLRRTAATRMAALGTLPHVVEAILNHSGGAISGVAAIYNRHTYEGEKRRALSAWARELERIAKGGERKVVTQIHKTKSG